MNLFERKPKAEPVEENVSLEELHAAERDRLRADALQDMLELVWYDGVHSYVDVAALAAQRDSFVAKGYGTAEEIRSLPEIRDAAERDITSVFGNNFRVSDFLEKRTAWAEAGLFSIEDANALPDVRDAVRENLFSAAGAHARNRKDAIERWRAAKVMTDAELDALAEETLRRREYLQLNDW